MSEEEKKPIADASVPSYDKPSEEKKDEKEKDEKEPDIEVDKIDKADASQSDDKKAEFDPDADGGPIKNRSCTDIICLALLIAFVCFWGFVGAWGLANGDPAKLLNPTNSWGQVCGQGELKDRPYLLFFDLTKCLSLNAMAGCPTQQVCVNKCPQDNWSPWIASMSPLPGALTGLGNTKKRMKPYCTEDLSEEMFEKLKVKQLMDKNYCPPWWVHSKPIMGRCLPMIGKLITKDEDRIPTASNGTIFADSPTGDVSLDKLKAAVAQVSKALKLQGMGDKIATDMMKIWWMILVGLFLSMLIALSWVFLMRWFAGALVWCALLGAMVVLTYVSSLAYNKYSSLPEDVTPFPWSINPSDYSERKGVWFVILIVCCVLLGLVLLLTVSLRDRIAIAIELIEEGSVACTQMCSTLFFPPLPFLFQAVVLAWGIFVAMYLLTSSVREYRIVREVDENRVGLCAKSCINPSTNESFNLGEDCTEWVDNFTSVCACDNIKCNFFKYGPSDTAMVFQLVNLFGIFWGVFFMEALGQLVLAGAFAGWYWTYDKKKNLPTNALTSSLYRSCRYHLGTVAFGSLIIAILRMIRLILEKIEAKLAQYHQDNMVVKAVMCCCKACFWCLEKFMKFLNRNAYIMCAVHGKNFCCSAKDAFFLLLRNIARLAVLTGVTNFLMFLGKIVVVGACAALSYFLFSGTITDKLSNAMSKVDELDDLDLDLDFPDLNYPLLPTLIITLGAYFLASCFFSVYEMAIDTIFLCFLEDSETNDGSPEKPFFMSKKLMKILGKKNKKEV